MSTRANVGRNNKDGSFDVIYTHWDGYPEHHAPILLEYYNTDKRMEMLLELGNLSNLEAKIGDKHDWSHPPEDTCNAYGRDRGEKDQEATHYANQSAFEQALAGAWTEWIYIWDVSSQQWYYTNNPSPTWFKCCGTEQLSEALLKDWKNNQPA